MNITTTITLHSVSSSNIDKIGFDSESETLEILFLSGGRYRYNCSAKQYKVFFNSKSKGKYFHKHFRDKPFQKIPGVQI